MLLLNFVSYLFFHFTNCLWPYCTSLSDLISKHVIKFEPFPFCSDSPVFQYSTIFIHCESNIVPSCSNSLIVFKLCLHITTKTSIMEVNFCTFFVRDHILQRPCLCKCVVAQKSRLWCCGKLISLLFVFYFSCH